MHTNAQATLVSVAAQLSSITLPIVSAVCGWLASLLLHMPADGSVLLALPALPFQACVCVCACVCVRVRVRVCVCVCVYADAAFPGKLNPKS